MQLLKPVWIANEGQSLMSIDVHPDGSRFVTGGQGESGGGRISIWNLKPVIDEVAEKNKDVPKLLAQMDHHLGCVNCVRWSFSGQMLASGGDDKLVMIWKKSAYGGGQIFGSKLKQVESWKLDKTLRGHEGDVLDLAWGPGDALLATASVDNNVVIWNAERFPDQVRILRGHTGLVKGVVFDPAGKYLASQSDDKTLRIWKTEDWSTEVVIKEPFTECGATTHVLRPGWSPEGSMLVSAHAMNGGGPTAQVVERGSSWKTQRDFVGHKKAVSCVRFCPSMLEKTSDDNGQKTESFVMVALGSRDRSFSVWTSSLQRPLFVVEDVFDQSVLDVAWSKDGKVLLSCSMDGSVACCVLTKKEIGRPYSDAELHSLMVSKHGKNVGKATLTKNMPKSKGQTVDKSALVIENPEMLKASQTNGAGALTNGAGKHVNGNSSSVAKRKASVPKGPTDKQIEARTPDGRRRITPIFIPPNSNEFEEDTFGSAEFGSSSRKGKSDIAVGIVSEKTMVSPCGKSNDSNSSNHSLMSERVPERKAAAAAAAAAASASTTSKSDPKEPKVSVIPVKKAPGPPPAAKQPSPPKKAASPPKASMDDEVVTSSKKKRKRILSSSSDDGDVDTASPPKSKPAKAPPPPPPPAPRPVSPPADDKKKRRIRPDMIGGPASSDTASPVTSLPPTLYRPESELVQPAVVQPVITHSRSGKILAPVKPFLSRTFKFDCGKRKIVVSVTNNAVPLAATDPRNSHLHSAEFQINTDPTLTWRTVFGSAVASVEGGNNLVCIICLDGSLHIYSSESKGEKAMPPLQLPSPPTKIHMSGAHLSIITVCGHLYVWDLNNGPRCLVSRENIEYLLVDMSGNPVSIVKLDHLTRADLCDHRPLVVTSAGKAYAFNTAMQAWMKVTDGSSLVATASKFSKTVMPSSGSSGLPLSSLTHVPSARPNVQTVNHETMHMATLAHCQDQKASAQILGSVEEFKFWTLNHIKELCEGGGERNADLIRSELGSLRDEAAHPMLSESDKKEVLANALNIIRGCLSLQRLFAEFEELEKSENEVSDLDKMILA